MDNFNIESAKKIEEEGHQSAIKTTIDGVEMYVPIDPANRHYAAIMELVDAGELTIAEADE